LCELASTGESTPRYGRQPFLNPSYLHLEREGGGTWTPMPDPVFPAAAAVEIGSNSVASKAAPS
jgi:hypothetical protein